MQTDIYFTKTSDPGPYPRSVIKKHIVVVVSDHVSNYSLISPTFTGFSALNVIKHFGVHLIVNIYNLKFQKNNSTTY